MIIKNIIFDFGGVLVDWNPRYLYKNLFNNEEEMEFFLENVCSPDWNEQQDAGRSVIEATKTLQLQFPEYKDMIQQFYDKWEVMVRGEIEENTQLLPRLKGNYNLYGLTNWSGETFPIAYKKYPFFQNFKGIVVSGDEKLIKPDKKIYQVLIERYSLNPNECLFIDDNSRNIQSAKQLGFNCVHFFNVNLEEELKSLGIILN